jgi:predicted enzyme related to lactoylglutathione lyase
MPERDGYIAGVPCWVDTSQPDPDAAAEFYGGLFGWEFEDAMPAVGPGRYLLARLRGGDVAAVSSPPEEAPAQAVWNTYIWVEDADEASAKAREAGGWRSSRTRRAPCSASGRRGSTGALGS